MLKKEYEGLLQEIQRLNELITQIENDLQEKCEEKTEASRINEQLNVLNEELIKSKANLQNEIQISSLANEQELEKQNSKFSSIITEFRSEIHNLRSKHIENNVRNIIKKEELVICNNQTMILINSFNSIKNDY